MENKRSKLSINLNVETGSLAESLRRLAYRIEKSTKDTDLSQVEMDECSITINGWKDYQNDLETAGCWETVYSKDRECLWLANELMGKTRDEVEETLSDYGDDLIVEFENDDENDPSKSYVVFEMLVEEVGQYMTVKLDFADGEVVDVDNFFED